MAVVFKSYENVLIRLFLHAEFNSALKTEIKSIFFSLRNMQKKKKKKYLSFFFFFFFSKRFKQNFLIPTESCFLDGKKPNKVKLVYINFLADSVKIRLDIELAKIQR